MTGVFCGRSDSRFIKIKLDLSDERDRLIHLYIGALESEESEKELESSGCKVKSSTRYPHSTLL